MEGYVRRKYEASQETKELFKPFFDLQSYLIQKKGKRLNQKEYGKSVDTCISSFYGTKKLSVNRAMQHGSGILIFIYETDKNKLFEKFNDTFRKKITEGKRKSFMEWILRCNCEIEELERVSMIIYGDKYIENMLNLIPPFIENVDNSDDEIYFNESYAYFERKILKDSIKSNDKIRGKRL